MTREEAIIRIKGLYGNGYAEQEQALDMAIKALEQEPCDDCVSRKAVLNTLDTTDKFLDKGRTVENYKALLKECYEVLTPVTPTRKKGKWIPTYGNVKCSVCGNVKDSRNVGKATHYCDFCGAKMESEG